MSSFKKVFIDAKTIFKEFSGYIHNEKDREYVAYLLNRIYSSEEFSTDFRTSIYWTLPFCWISFGKKNGLPKNDFLILIKNFKLQGGKND